MSPDATQHLEDLIESLKSLVAKHDISILKKDWKSSDANYKEYDLMRIAEMLYAIRGYSSHGFANYMLFRGPTWDILLHLFIAHSQGKPVSASSACDASGVTPAAALRWIAVLAQEELVEQKNDPLDESRTWLRLSTKGAEAVRNVVVRAAKRLDQEG